MITLAEYQKKKEYLICVDSDGCAMDTMDIKHIRAFGPEMVKEWDLWKWEQSILTRWNEINLYSLTRGINRFKALSMALEEIHEKYRAIEGIKDLINWAENSDELSNAALARTITEHPSPALQKALHWSEAVNERIKTLPEEEMHPFPLAKEALEHAHRYADVAIVSSANPGAVLEEWGRFGLLEHTDIVLCQNVGSKAFCIAELLKKGYDAEKVLMCGDAPGDLKAAEQNGVFYYPILVKNEEQSWREFINVGCTRLVQGSYGGEYQKQMKNKFLENLK